MSAENEYVQRSYILKCLEDSWKNAGISSDARSKFIKWLMKAPCVIAPRPMEKPLVKADTIRMMSDEELADFLCDRSCMLCPIKGDCGGRMEIGRKACEEKWRDYLKQEE